MDQPDEPRRRTPSKVMPYLALLAGAGLLALEWRDGSTFWFWFAVVLIGFAVIGIVAWRAPPPTDRSQ
jgi:hypothetical protein